MGRKENRMEGPEKKEGKESMKREKTGMRRRKKGEEGTGEKRVTEDEMFRGRKKEIKRETKG